VLEWVRDLFRKEYRECDACLARQEHIASLESEVNAMREERRMLHEKLFLALRLERHDQPTVAGLSGQVSQATQMNQVSHVRSWTRMKRDLERAHLRKDDDAKLEYWQGVNEKLEDEFGSMKNASKES